MTIADYIIDFFITNDLKYVFGYQGGMIAYLFDSMGKRHGEIEYCECGTEQGASLAACAYAQATGKPGVVICTSGPGFTNMLTGIANAYFDSIPLICIAGQVNTKDKKRSLKVRQLGFQEIQATQIAEPITKKTYELDDDSDISNCFDEALLLTISGRKGPVFIDLPINICRNEINQKPKRLTFMRSSKSSYESLEIIKEIQEANRPIVIAGAGIRQSGTAGRFVDLMEKLRIPVVTTMPAIDLLPSDHALNMGYIGGTARREAGIIFATCDLVISFGARLIGKQIGYDYEMFAPKAKLIRIDIDEAELERKIKDDEIVILADIKDVIDDFEKRIQGYTSTKEHNEWLMSCQNMKMVLRKNDVTFGNSFVKELTSILPEDCNIIGDVGNNLIYSAQSSVIKRQTRFFISGGLGAMGYALPAAIGAYYGNGKKTLVIVGDGGIQMNIQELNLIAKKKLPIVIVVMNNKALGHIMLFQDLYLEHRHHATEESQGDYYSCNFSNIAKAYGICGIQIRKIEDLMKCRDVILGENPGLIELIYEDCAIVPNIHGGHDCLESGPELPSEVIQKIIDLGFEKLTRKEE